MHSIASIPEPLARLDGRGAQSTTGNASPIWASLSICCLWRCLWWAWEQFLFCFALENCYELLKAEVEDVVDHAIQDCVLMSEEPVIQKTRMFKVKLNVFHYVGAHGIYHSYLRMKSRYQIFFADCAIQFWQRGYSALRWSNRWARMPKRGTKWPFMLQKCRYQHPSSVTWWDCTAWRALKEGVQKVFESFERSL